jgi:tetratricopeptide (TPR) repeat protein
MRVSLPGTRYPIRGRGVASGATLGQKCRRRRIAAIAIWGLAFLAAPAAAQESAPAESEPAETTEARTLFYEGVEASRARDWAVAEERFVRAYELLPRAETLFNLAGARMRAGKLVDAIMDYREFMNTAPPELIAQWGAEVRAAISALEGRIARVTIRVRGLDAGDVVELDDRELAAAELGTAIAIDPGTHRVIARRDGRIVAEQRATIGEGAHSEIDIVMVQTRDVAVPRPETEPEDDGVSFFESPWTWTIAGLLLAGGATALVLAFTIERSPFEGSIPPGSTGVR